MTALRFDIEAQSRAANFAIQYGALAIGQCVGGSKFVDPVAPGKLFLQGVESNSAGSGDKRVLILSSLSSKDPNASLAFGGNTCTKCFTPRISDGYLF